MYGNVLKQTKRICCIIYFTIPSLLMTGPYIPYTLHVFIGSDGSWGEEIILEDNSALLAQVESVRWPKREYGQFQSSNWPEKRQQVYCRHVMHAILTSYPKNLKSLGNFLMHVNIYVHCVYMHWRVTFYRN